MILELVEEFKTFKKRKNNHFKGILKSGLLSVSRGDLESKANFILHLELSSQSVFVDYRSTNFCILLEQKAFWCPNFRIINSNL